MAYIGNVPADKYTTFDKQTITGDGGTGYTLDHAVANAQEIEVFVNNVRQEPGVAYTVSGTALTMTGNVASTDDFYVVYQGKAIQTVVPADDTITTAMLQNNSVTSAKVDSTVLTGASDLTGLTGVPTNNTPNFSAKRSGDQTGIPNASAAEIIYNATLYDSDSGFNTTTGKYTVPTGKGGKYYIRGGFRTNASGSMTRCVAYIYVNGSGVAEYNNPQITNGETASAVESVLDLSAGDVVDIRIFQNSGSSIGVQDGTKSLFFGFRLSE